MRRARVHWGDAYLFSCTRDRWVGAARLLGERQLRLEAAAAVAYRTNRAMLIHPPVLETPIHGETEIVKLGAAAGLATLASGEARGKIVVRVGAGRAGS